MFDWDFTHTVTLDYNCCPGVGLQFRHQDPEYAELISSFRGQQWKDALSDEALRKDVIEATAGQVGPACTLADPQDVYLSSALRRSPRNSVLRACLISS